MHYFILVVIPRRIHEKGYIDIKRYIHTAVNTIDYMDFYVIGGRVNGRLSLEHKPVIHDNDYGQLSNNYFLVDDVIKHYNENPNEIIFGLMNTEFDYTESYKFDRNTFIETLTKYIGQYVVLIDYHI